MNGALYLLNGLALAAVVSFHFFAPPPDRQLHMDVQGLVKHPVAQRAGMHERQRPGAVMVTSPALEEVLRAPTGRLDRYTF